MMNIWRRRPIAWSGCSMGYWCNRTPVVQGRAGYQNKKLNYMLINYFKIAIAVLKRRKFFTFISLFGISFTLTIIIVLTAFIDQVVSNTYPDRKRDRSLYINNMEEIGGTKGNESSSSGPVSFYFLDHYAGSLKPPAAIAISSTSNSTNAYIN